MCESTTTIRFCTCTDEVSAVKKSASPSQSIFRWTLSKYDGRRDTSMDGILMEPGDKLNDHITDADLAAELNSRNCFDFDYAPADGDNLEVWSEPRNSVAPMSFIFTGDRWIIRQYNSFTDKTRKVYSGKIVF